MGFVRVAAAAEIAVGKGRLVERDGVAVAVFNAGAGRFYAASPSCPHEGGPLVDGWVEDETAVCPWHGFGFDLAGGRCLTDPALSIAVYAVRLVGGEIEVDLP